MIPIKIFYSYSSKDKELRDKLASHLSSLRRQGMIEDWYDRCIEPGQNWQAQIDEHLNSAQLILPLISSDFINSDYCQCIEMARALERHKSGEAKIIPIILRPVVWDYLEIGSLQCLPTGAKAVIDWPHQDSAFVDIVLGIRQTVQSMQRTIASLDSIPTQEHAASPGRYNHQAGSPMVDSISTREPAANPDELRLNYLTLLVREWRALRFASLDPAAADPRSWRPLTLEQVYVSLNTTTPRVQRLDATPVGVQIPLVSAVEALWSASDKHMVLLGRPGSGKSTFARYLVLAMAQTLRGAATLDSQQLHGWQEGRAVLPVLVVLVRLAAKLPRFARRGTATMVESFICSQVGDDHRFGYGHDHRFDHKPRLKKKIVDLQQQWDLLNERLMELNKNKIMETRSEERFRLEKLIDDTKTQRDQIEEQLKDMESQLAKTGSDAKEGAGRNDDHSLGYSNRQVAQGLPNYGDLLLQDFRNEGGLVIFDGLDEVPDQQRQLIKEAVSDFANRYPNCWVLVTCRTHSYQQDASWHLDWPTVRELAPFNHEQINTFIDAWYEALSANDTATDYSSKAKTLKAALDQPGDHKLAELARNPLMLTVMAGVHTRRVLPTNRVEVYRECVENLLFGWYRENTPNDKSRLINELQELGISDGKLFSGLLELAYTAHSDRDRIPVGGKNLALVSEQTIRCIMLDYLGDEGLKRFLVYCKDANGLLMAESAVELPNSIHEQPVYGFIHLSFEEYLAALHFKQNQNIAQIVEKAAELAGNPAWWEVIHFLGESWCFGRDLNIGMAKLLLDCLCPQQMPVSEAEPVNEADWRRILLAGELLPAVRNQAPKRLYDPGLGKRIIDHLIKLLHTPEALSNVPADRAMAGRALAHIGDSRPGVRLGQDKLPDLLWIRIPGTKTVCSSSQFANFSCLKLGTGAKPDEEARRNENWPISANPIEINDFELAAYPVTVAQFRPFVEQDGYRQDHYWSQAGRQARNAGNWITPWYWDDPYSMLDNYPVVGVSWYEVEAYCNWLNTHLPPNQKVRLPTEAEWEWAARGPEGQRFPWGVEAPVGRCNFDKAGINSISTVGIFPNGACVWWQKIWPSSEALHDLVGNVFEWTGSEYIRNYSKANCLLDSSIGQRGVFRGGAWFSSPAELRAAARHYHLLGGDRHYYCGFRLTRDKVEEINKVV